MNIPAQIALASNAVVEVSAPHGKAVRIGDALKLSMIATLAKAAP